MKINNKKNEIVEIAYHLFVTKGYTNTSVDEIILNVGIAKGTFYYYFKTKEELLEEVIEKILKQEEEKAIYVLNSDMPLEEKFVGIIASMRPESNEASIAEELNKPENIIMHNKINEKIIEKITPILATVVGEGIGKGVFSCDNVEERIKLLLIISSQMFDDNNYTRESVSVFIETVEKILGTQKGTMEFIAKLIN